MNETCPIWNTPADVESTAGVDGLLVDSPRAGGRYFISGTAAATLATCAQSLKARLTSWLVEQRRYGVESPKIDSETLTGVERRRHLSVHERADKLLQYLREKSQHIGHSVSFFWEKDEELMELAARTETSSRFYDKISTEMHFLLEYLKKRHYLNVDYHTAYFSCVLEAEGYARLAELESRHTESSQAFVAMWFDESLEPAYEKGIAPAVKASGYSPLRIDRKEHVERIDDQIISEIRKSRFIVCDFTCGLITQADGEEVAVPRGGVYFEAGFARGLNIPVIWTCRKNCIEHVHFDTRQFAHILWEIPEDLREQLKQRIGAVIGDGPLPKA